jgi:hypothetical protein
MSNKPVTQFGRRETALAVQRDGPGKRSGHVALLLAGTVAVGGGAFALMPGENCTPAPPGMTAPTAGCSPRSSSSGGSSRYGFYGGDASVNKSASGTSPSGSGNVTRGGFGSFAHAFTAHFSGGS